MSSRKRSYAGVSTSALRKRAAKYEAKRGMPLSFRQKGLMLVSKETGYIDLPLTTYGLDSTGSITLLCAVSQGTSVNQRVGKKIALKSLQFRGNMTARITALINNVAYMVVYDKRPTGVLPAITDVINAVTPNSMNNDNNSGRFRVLKRVDETLIGNTDASAAFLTDCTSKSQEWFLPLRDAETVYKAAATGAIGDIEQGALYLITVGDIAASSAAANLTGVMRLRFLDI